MGGAEAGAPVVSSALLDVTIALALSFAAVAALSSAILEIYARAFARRAAHFAAGVRAAFGDSGLVLTVARTIVNDRATPSTAERGVIGFLRRREAMLSGVSVERFVAAATAQLRADGFFDGALAAPWLEAARGDPKKLEAVLTEKFVAMTRRASDEFRARSAAGAFVLSLAVAWTFNVDALAVAERAYDAARGGAAPFVTQADTTGSIEPSDLTELIVRLRGETCRSGASLEFWPATAIREAIPGALPCSPANGTALLGWFLTALFAMPGAKFWYDVAANLLRYRAAAR